VKWRTGTADADPYRHETMDADEDGRFLPGIGVWVITKGAK
jgi:hypothetical protein